ncbi:hypothetical protein FC99_GL001800 [Levilactobacillus koreensis JCM 16448]|uniref:Sce7725 family protein n=1 Tax=Levilactobacillus koreensis TaxID=637971 RepID=A0AAC8ZGY1_9LACO|nr:sce7725 family protein [Levilactobacillus koreensis]AKP65355.1 hypothetical protein ABN16_10315 [Levilactobacillus koreensis]KRK86053.1 hypothetical protein FC99_GL001800 [Levilactobacillus koreensis JCM 16448]
MYYPVLRGKLYEILALHELLDAGKLSTQIVPVIEPVRASTSFKKLLLALKEKKRTVAVIQNSQLVEYSGLSDIQAIKAATNFIPAYLLTDENLADFQKMVGQDRIGIVEEESDFTDTSVLEANQDWVAINQRNRRAQRLFKNLNNVKAIELNDDFTKLTRNADYLDTADEFFSDDHLHYLEDGFVGFGDYSIVGSDFARSGFAPRAVSIHIVYFAADDTLRIRHFTSNSNGDVRDPGGKYLEALDKLMTWVKSSEFDHAKNDSAALRDFERMAREEVYSGLGVVKKLSIAHHLEIMGRYLEERA